MALITHVSGADLGDFLRRELARPCKDATVRRVATVIVMAGVIDRYQVVIGYEAIEGDSDEP